MFLLWVYLLMAIGISFLCSLLEAVLLSLPSSFVALIVENNVRGSALIKKQKDNISKPLAAILTLNTVAHTLGAAGVGAQVSIIWGEQWLALAGVVLTLLVLFLSEIIPKTIGAVNCKELARPAAFTIEFLVYLTYPLVFLLDKISRLLSASDRVEISREEIRAISHLGEKAGALSKNESSIIKNLLAIETFSAEQIMTPLSVVFSLDSRTKLEEIIESHRILPFSRIPIFENDKQNIIGIAIRFKIFSSYLNNRGSEPVSALTIPVTSVESTTNLGNLFKMFLKKSEHIFIVKKFGEAIVIVTLEDAIETLMGVEIVDETDTVVDMQELARRLDKKLQSKADLLRKKSRR